MRDHTNNAFRLRQTVSSLSHPVQLYVFDNYLLVRSDGWDFFEGTLNWRQVAAFNKRLAQRLAVFFFVLIQKIFPGQIFANGRCLSNTSPIDTTGTNPENRNIVGLTQSAYSFTHSIRTSNAERPLLRLRDSYRSVRFGTGILERRW